MVGYYRRVYLDDKGNPKPPTFDNTYSGTLAELRTVAVKPIVITELGATEVGGNKPEWIHSLFQGLADNPDIIGFVWFDHSVNGTDWRIESSGAASTAFADGVADPRYRAGVIRPPKPGAERSSRVRGRSQGADDRACAIASPASAPSGPASTGPRARRWSTRAIDAMADFLRSGDERERPRPLRGVGRVDRRRRRRPALRRPAARRRSRRHRVRRQHDDAQLRAHPRARPRLVGRATRSSAPGSTTTRTSRRGGSPPTTAARSCGSPSSTPRPAGSTPTRSPRSSARAPAGSRSPARRTRSARCRTLAPIVAAAHAAGARVLVDAVHLVPARGRRHRRARLRRVPHVAVQVVRPARRRALARARPARLAHAVQGAARARHRRPSGGRRARRRSRRSPRSGPPPRSCSTPASTRSPRHEHERVPAAARRPARAGPRDRPRTAGPRGPDADRVLPRRRPPPRRRRRRRSPRARSRSGAATTTRSRRWPRSASPTAARSAPASPATRPTPTSPGLARRRRRARTLAVR